MKRSSVTLGKMHTLKLCMKFHHTPIRIVKNALTIASAAAAVEPLASHMLLAADRAATWEIIASYKARHTDNPVIPLLDVSPREMKM